MNFGIIWAWRIQYQHKPKVYSFCASLSLLILLCSFLPLFIYLLILSLCGAETQPSLHMLHACFYSATFFFYFVIYKIFLFSFETSFSISSLNGFFFNWVRCLGAVIETNTFLCVSYTVVCSWTNTSLSVSHVHMENAGVWMLGIYVHSYHALLYLFEFLRPLADSYIGFSLQGH